MRPRVVAKLETTKLQLVLCRVFDFDCAAALSQCGDAKMEPGTPVSATRFAPHPNLIRDSTRSFRLQQRRSNADWMCLLEEVFDETNDSRSVPLAQLSSCLARFQERKGPGYAILAPDELESLARLAEDNPDGPDVGVEQLMGFLVQFGAASSPARQAIEDAALQQATPTRSTPLSPSDEFNGSPRSKIRTLSPTNSLDSLAMTTPQRPSKLPKRRSFLAALSSAGSPARSSPVPDLVDIVVASRETYLGVSLDGPLGEGWDAEALALGLRAATKGLGVSANDDPGCASLTISHYRQRKKSSSRYWRTR